MIVVPSTMHLKMEYYTSKGLVATLLWDIKAASRCVEAASKGLNNINTSTRNKPTLPNSSEKPQSLPCVDSIDLDSRLFKDDVKDKKSSLTTTNLYALPDLEPADPLCLIPDREFEVILPRWWSQQGSQDQYRPPWPIKEAAKGLPKGERRPICMEYIRDVRTGPKDRLSLADHRSDH